MALEADIRHLSRNPTFAALEADALRELALGAETIMLRKGEILFRREDVSDCGYLLVFGSILLETDPGQGEQIVRPPTLIGDTALITRTRRPVTATAREQCSLLKISRLHFLSVMNDFPRSAERLKRIISDRLVQFIRELDGIARDVPD
ncbi:MAG TPA: cyclic nucleotide-binding domain-containing protein [Methylovirgula sp.]|jgi:CRP-like cAMP-binding protein|nr:cyclic nucleotide-binding domain-containing protein [Methylovirgula sp.]